MRKQLLPVFCASFALLAGLFAPEARAQRRILQSVDDLTSRSTLADTTAPRMRASADLGPVDASLQLENLTLRFSLSDAQNAALDQLLSDQQNPSSPRYHQWLTPESFAAQFGLIQSDLSTVRGWLQAQGLTVTGVARGGTFLSFSGTAAQVQKAFGTSIHSVSLNGETHFGNINNVSLPAPIAAVVGGITGLNDFRLKPHVHAHSVPASGSRFTSSVSGSTFIAPGDFFTIYDTAPLLTQGIDGTGITIAVAGQTDVSLADVAAFRSASGLAANAPQVMLYGKDPGIPTAGDLEEAQLDLEWSGAIAPSAKILFVNSTDVLAGSLTQAIDNNLAPIVTVSYGDCEINYGSTSIASFNQLFKQANAQGQTILGPAGDSGATDCDYQVNIASNGLAVDFPASSPYVTGVGGTMFNENGGTYFGSTNNNYAGSALSYIPEAVWNESALGGGLASGGGGVSSYFTKPAYQVGTGVPNDFSRDVPDVSFNAAASHDGYLFCAQGSCTNGFRNAAGNLNVVGGTSVSTPAFAGIMALLQQSIAKRVGNANPTIYGLANSSFYSSVFHDVTVGNNSSPCTTGSTNCPNGGTIGYGATVGYDLATGWGSVDALRMVNDWLLVTPTGITSTIGPNVSATTLSTTQSTTLTAGGTLTFTVQVSSATSGVTTMPTGTVQLLVDNVPNGVSAMLVNGTATLTLTTATLVSGGHTIGAAYLGDTTYNGSKGAILIDIVSASAADFVLTPATATVTVASGSTASGITFTVTPTNGFTGQVTFSAATTSSALAAQYSFNPTTVTISSSAAGSTVFTLIANASSVTGATLFRTGAGQASTQGLHRGLEWAGSGITLAGLILLLLPGRRTRWSALAAAALLSVGTLSLAGCSGPSGTSTGTNTNATPGTYTILVTATGTNAVGTKLSHNSTVTFVVQ